jgi:hypothetical protein
MLPSHGEKHLLAGQLLSYPYPTPVLLNRQLIA